ncbi:MAG: OmpA family protein [Planctomycetes bacterium]|nr:OmpA family protein [Planctomycetota bacterium]
MKITLTCALQLGLLLGGACVAPQRYDEALGEAKYFQRQYQDLSSFHGQLEAENARLRGELELYQGKPIESAATKEIDERLERLRHLTEQIGTSSGAAPGDVEFLSVEGGYGVRVTDEVLFDSGSDEIKPEGKVLLQKVAQQISEQPYQRIWVRGHTDSDPVKRATTIERFPHGNIQLSAARAVEVAALLAASGLQEPKIVVAGFGPAEPVVPNQGVENKRRNRRVEIFVLDESGAER